MYILFSWLSAIISAVGVTMVSFGFSVSNRTAKGTTELWGRKLPPIPKIKRARLWHGIGWAIITLGIILFFVSYLQAMWEWEFPLIIWLLPLIGLFAPIPVVFAIVKPDRWTDKVLASAGNALSLGAFEILQAVDSRIPEAKLIALCWDAIVLYDDKGYCFYRAAYGDYRLGDLKEQDQLILLGYYFRQKYAGQFQYSAKVDTIYMNHTNVTANGTGYVNVSSGQVPIAQNIKEIYFTRM